MFFCITLDLDVRIVVFENLDRSFDFYLAQVHNLTILFMAMNDVNFEIREMALCTIGRLSLVNPAYVMPPLRKTLMQVCQLLMTWVRIKLIIWYVFDVSV